MKLKVKTISRYDVNTLNFEIDDEVSDFLNELGSSDLYSITFSDGRVHIVYWVDDDEC